ncbi:hypothetical protein CWI38_1030p0030 [Hamiltosporidium tvaerminnensis]|uniref:Nucleolar protein 9 n=1 Tax=Hamiltosporidium tvaerminnensis TaxID=1176355 RepID=A0A4V2JXH1_9MICR|nr:hypothetical protein CWI38_1030p0030 [Hamiltosporidium tvaerminnensis]
MSDILNYFLNVQFENIKDTEILQNIYNEINKDFKEIILNRESCYRLESLLQKSSCGQLLDFLNSIDIKYFICKKLGSRILEKVFTLLFMHINVHKSIKIEEIEVFIKFLEKNFLKYFYDPCGTFVIRVYFQILCGKFVFYDAAHQKQYGVKDITNCKYRVLKYSNNKSRKYSRIDSRNNKSHELKSHNLNSKSLKLDSKSNSLDSHSPKSKSLKSKSLKSNFHNLDYLYKLLENDISNILSQKHTSLSLLTLLLCMHKKNKIIKKINISYLCVERLKEPVFSYFYETLISKMNQKNLLFFYKKIKPYFIQLSTHPISNYVIQTLINTFTLKYKFYYSQIIKNYQLFNRNSNILLNLVICLQKENKYRKIQKIMQIFYYKNDFFEEVLLIRSNDRYDSKLDFKDDRYDSKLDFKDDRYDSKLDDRYDSKLDFKDDRFDTKNSKLGKKNNLDTNINISDTNCNINSHCTIDSKFVQMTVNFLKSKEENEITKNIILGFKNNFSLKFLENINGLKIILAFLQGNTDLESKRWLVNNICDRLYLLGRNYYGIEVLQCMTLYCDWDMKREIYSFVRKSKMLLK